MNKLDASGNFVWARQLGATGDDRGNGVAVDGLGNVYTTGFFAGTADFNPGAGTFNLTSAGSADIFLSKLINDTTAPDTTIDSNPTNPTNDNTPTFTFSGTDATSGVASYEVKVDGGAFATQTSPFTTGILTDGSHTVEVRAIDNAGNTDATPASFTFVVDTAGPAVNISAPSASSTLKGPITYTVTIPLNPPRSFGIDYRHGCSAAIRTPL